MKRVSLRATAALLSVLLLRTELGAAPMREDVCMNTGITVFEASELVVQVIDTAGLRRAGQPRIVADASWPSQEYRTELYYLFFVYGTRTALVPSAVLGVNRVTGQVVERESGTLVVDRPEVEAKLQLLRQQHCIPHALVERYREVPLERTFWEQVYLSFQRAFPK